MPVLFSRSLLAALTLALFTPFSTAGTLTVGPAGSGAQFTQIQAAVDAALAGDVILVKPGTYQAIVVDKPLRILGDGTGLVLISGTQFGASIHDIAAGQEFVLSGLDVRVTSSSSNPLVRFQNCPGTVVLHDVNVHGSDPEMGGVGIQNCRRAVLLDSQIDGWGAVAVLDSSVWLANSAISGAPGFFGDAPPGVRLERSTLHLWRSQVYGGDSITWVPKTGGPGGVGVLALSSVLNLFGGFGAEIVGGNGSYDAEFDWNYPGGAGLHLRQGSSARIQAGMHIAGGLSGLGDSQAVGIKTDGTTSHTFDPTVFPSLFSSPPQVQVGASVTMYLGGSPGGTQILFQSLRAAPTGAVPPPARRLGGLGPGGRDDFGLFILDRTQLTRIAAVTLSGAGESSFPFQIPNVPALIGSTMVLQNVERTASRLEIGNPVLVSITH